MALLNQLFVSSIVSLLAGWFLHVLKTKADDKKAREGRKINVLTFVSVWESDVAHEMSLVFVSGLPGGNVPGTFISATTRQFHSNTNQLIEKATELEANYRGETLLRFRGVVQAVTLMKANTNDKAGQKELLTALRTLADFVRKN
jgi:hypothetical protein